MDGAPGPRPAPAPPEWRRAGRPRFAFLLAALLLLAWQPVHAAPGDASGTVCARVEIRIEQQLTLERQAFDAHMKVVNGLESVPLEDVTVDVTFADADGNTVRATSDPDDDSAAFFIRVDRLDNVDSVDGGTIAGGTEANMHWLIVPSPGAADANPNGTLYFVGAELSYTYNGEQEQVSVTPDSIRVEPMPKLTLDYFLPRYVDADDPLTEPVEPAIPFTLGVRVQNTGAGPANDLAIESAQPEIVNNEVGLPIDFTIIDSHVGAEPSAPTLKLDFGQIDADDAQVGRWRMKTTYSGRFTEFDATFTHADRFGGELTSLLEATHTHTLVGDVRVDVPGRDAARDFLADDADGLRVYESNGTDTAVTDHSDASQLDTVSDSGDTAVLELSVPATDGFLYAAMDDPFAGDYRVDRVVRDDGKVLADANAWFATAYLSGGAREHRLHLFDANAPAGEYTLYLKAVSLEPGDPVIRFIPDQTTHVGGQVGFLVESGDAAGNEPALSMSGPGLGEAFTDNGDGTGRFQWSPQAGADGTHTVTFTAEHGGATATRDVRITVHPADDTDGDGLDDAWERRHFGDLSRDGSGDFSGDGISDRMAYERGLDPTQRYNDAALRLRAGSAIVDDNWRELAKLEAFAAPVVITGPASLNDADPGTVQLATRDDGRRRVRFAEWPHLDGEHARETLDWLAADPGSYVVDDGDDDLLVEVGTFELDAAGRFSEVAFRGDFPEAPTVLTTIQRDAAPERPLTARVESVSATGLSAGVFAQASAAGTSAADVTVGYIAIHDADGEGTLPRLDSDAAFERFTHSIAGQGAAVADTTLRRQNDGALGGDPAPSAAEPVGGLAFDGHIFAASQQAGRAAAATVREGATGGEAPVFNFARPNRIVSADDDAVTVEIVRSGNTVDAASVRLDSRGRTAVGGRDFAALDGRAVDFAAGEKLHEVDIALIDGGNDRPSQAFDLHLDASQGAGRTGAPASSLITVVDGPVDDTDSDGMADVWERHYFSGIAAIDGSGDQDGDGTIDRRAFLEGRDPTAGAGASGWLHWQPRAVVDGRWTDLAIAGADSDAVLIGGVPSDYGEAAGTVRYRRDAAGTPQARFARWSGDGAHGAETLAVLAVEPGRHELGADTWAAARVDGVDGDTWRRVEFASPFPAAPHVLTSVASAHSGGAVAARVRNVTTDGFEVRLAGAGGSAERIGYLAIGGAVAAGEVTIDDASHDYRVDRLALDHDATGFHGEHLRLEPGAKGTDTWPVEMVDALLVGGRPFATAVTRAGSGPLAPRRRVPDDGDEDGLADRWELEHGLDPTRFADATQDNDADGAATLAEFVAGTDPQDPHETPDGARPRLRTPLVSAWGTPVPFGAEYDAPVVIAGAPTNYDPEPGVVRLDFIDGTGARARFAEWRYLDGVHGRERAPLLVLEAGRHLVAGDQVWEAGRTTVDGGARWQHVAFERAHDRVPHVVATPQTSLATTPRIARVRNVTKTGFEVAVFAERGADAGTGEQARIGYVAASALERRDADTTGYVRFDGRRHRFRLERSSVDHTATELGRTRLRLEPERSLGGAREHDPETVAAIRFDAGVFAQDTSYNDARPAAARHLTASGDDALMPSEAFLVRHGLDPEDPDVADLDVSGDGFTVLEEYIAGTDIFDPDDSPVRAKIRTLEVSANDQWNSASFARTYDDPVVLAGAATANDAEPGVVRLRGLDSGGVDVRFAEWAYLDGVHAFEDIPLLVMDAGRHLVDDSQIWEVEEVDVAKPGQWQQVEFRRAHDSVPQVLATIQTANSEAPLVARVRNVTESGFELALFAEEGGAADDYNAETVGFLAASGTSDSGEVDYAGSAHAFQRSQVALTDTATDVGATPLRLQGETSANTDTGHEEELVDVLTFDGALFAQDVTFNDPSTAVVRQGEPE